MEKSPITTAAAILGLSVIITGSIGIMGIFRMRSLSDTIAVTGSAERLITSDIAKWTVQISHPSALDGIQQANAAMESDLRELKLFLTGKGIKDEWVVLSPISVETQYDYNQGGIPSGYILRQTVVIEAADIPTVKAAAEAAGELIGKGALVSTVSLEYFYSKLSEIKQEILASAMEDAKSRATKIVEAANSSLGSLKDASMGVLQVTAKNSVEIADYGMYDTSALEKKVTAVVRASFGIR